MEIPSKYLPSKEYLQKLGTLVLIVIIVIVFQRVFVYGKKYLAMRQGGSVAPIIVSDLVAQDTDLNGIPDWQDSLNASLGNSPIASQTEHLPINETDQFARDLVSTAATIGQSGNITDAGADSIANEVTNQIASASVGETFTTADIKPVADSKKNQDAYIKQAKNLLDVKYPLDVDNSIAILQDALSAGDASGLSALDPISERYEKLIEAFKALSVPNSYAENHLGFLNVLGKIHGSIGSMKNTFSNPVMTMSVIMKYSSVLNDLIGYIAAFTTKFPYSKIATDVGNASPLPDANSMINSLYH